MSDFLLDIQGVVKRFGGLTAVKSVDLQIPRQAIASLIGPNGAGKTTFFNCITGFYTPEEGQMLLDGRSIGDAHAAAREPDCLGVRAERGAAGRIPRAGKGD